MNHHSTRFRHVIQHRAARRRRPRDERGTATAEYAVGTLGAAACGAVLLTLAGDDWFLHFVEDVLQRALDPFTLIDILRDRLGGLPRLGHR